MRNKIIIDGEIKHREAREKIQKILDEIPVMVVGRSGRGRHRALPDLRVKRMDHCNSVYELYPLTKGEFVFEEDGSRLNVEIFDGRLMRYDRRYRTCVAGRRYSFSFSLMDYIEP